MPKKYPSCIIPKIGYRYRFPMRKLLVDYPDLAVVRRSDSSNPFVYSSNGDHRRLRGDALGQSLIELSVNLLGGLYKMKHLPFAPILELVKEDWNGLFQTKLPVPDTSYSVKPEWGIIAFRVCEANVFSFPYTKSIKMEDYEKVRNQAEKAKIRENLRIDTEIVGALGQAANNMTNVYGWLHVNHHPNDLNYWHMQVDVYKPGCDDYIRQSEKSQKENRRLNQQLRVHIGDIAICELGYKYHIGKKYYQRSVCCFTSYVDILKNWFCRRCLKFSHSLAVSES